MSSGSALSESIAWTRSSAAATVSCPPNSDFRVSVGQFPFSASGMQHFSTSVSTAQSTPPHFASHFTFGRSGGHSVFIWSPLPMFSPRKNVAHSIFSAALRSMDSAGPIAGSTGAAGLAAAVAAASSTFAAAIGSVTVVVAGSPGVSAFCAGVPPGVSPVFCVSFVASDAAWSSVKVVLLALVLLTTRSTDTARSTVAPGGRPSLMLLPLPSVAAAPAAPAAVPPRTPPAPGAVPAPGGPPGTSSDSRRIADCAISPRNFSSFPSFSAKESASVFRSKAFRAPRPPSVLANGFLISAPAASLAPPNAPVSAVAAGPPAPGPPSAPITAPVGEYP
mmetsp:Transcript_26302/g.66315  ORF Transcript_26302/g.66315 Transcript_26302/m.66315 type:complete len:334 (-) Transcript_26302:45-1046(-)